MCRRLNNCNMITLGLDPSLRSYGWAVYDSKASGLAKRIASGHEGTLSSSVPVARFMHFRSLVYSLLKRWNVDAVGIESPAYQAGPFQSIHFGLMMFSLEAVFENRKDCVLFDPSTLKFLAREDSSKNRGKMQKLNMQRYVQLDTMDPNVINDNEADAYCIAKFSSRFLNFSNGDLKTEDLTPSELRVFATRNSSKTHKRVAYAFRENSRFFKFSRVPTGSVSLPSKLLINKSIISFLDSLEDSKKGTENG